MEIVEVDKKYYHNILDMLPKTKRQYIDRFVDADHYFLGFDGDPIGGFAFNVTGALKGLFSLKKGNGRELLEKQQETARKYSDDGIRYFDITCIGKQKRDYFKKAGFWVEGYLGWDEDLAPNEWQGKKEAVYFMVKRTAESV